MNPAYYLIEFWEEFSDADNEQLLGMAWAPWSWVLFTFMLAYFIRLWGPRYMEGRKAFELRPWMIILNSFAFGANAIGLFAAFWITDHFKSTFDCSAYDPLKRDYESIAVKYFAYILVYAKAFDFVKPILSVLSKKKLQISNLHLLHAMFFTIAAGAMAKVNPGGIFIAFALLDSFYCIMVYSYLLFAAASKEFKPSVHWKMAILFTRMFTIGLGLAHSSFFLAMENCGHPVLKIFSVFYAILMLLLFPYDWYATEEKIRQLKCQRRFSISRRNTTYMEQLVSSRVLASELASETQ